MELAVALEYGFKHGPVFLTTGGIVGLHTHIDAHQEVLEVKTDTEAVGRGNLLIEFIELECAARLVLLIIPDGPDIACIDKQAQLDNPEELCPILQIDIKADITTLVEEVGQAIVDV